jgi:hypothetical protein
VRKLVVHPRSARIVGGGEGHGGRQGGGDDVTVAVQPAVWALVGAENGELKAQGKVIDSITEDQEEYYGFDESDFADPSSDGRVKMLLSSP